MIVTEQSTSIPTRCIRGAMVAETIAETVATTVAATAAIAAQCIHRVRVTADVIY